jgi:type III secretion protein C
MKKLLITTLAMATVSYAQPEPKTVIETVAPSVKKDAGKEGEYNYFFYGEPLEKCIAKFASNHGYRVVFGDGLAKSYLREPVNGRFKVTDSTIFLNNLADQYGFNWFVYSGVLYITGLQQETIRLDVDADNMADTKYHLEQSGLLSSKFSYAELVSQNKIVISGPHEYVQLVREKVQELNVASANQQFGVFRLKYANATDLQYTFNNQQIVIPGVATVLQSLISGRNTTSRMQFNPNVKEILKNSPLGESNTASRADSQTNDREVTGSGGAIIQADNRLNTLIVRDKSGNMNLFKDLIRQLDVPAPLIQIEVMIVHLDHDKLSQKGVNWWASGTNGLSGGFGVANLNNGPTNNLSLSYGQVNPGQLIVTNLGSFASNLQYLENDKIAQTVAKPSLATTDNIPAIVSTTENVTSANLPANNNANNPNNFGMTGIQLVHSLQITPHVIYDPEQQKNQIKLTIALQDGAVNEFSNPILPNYAQSYINSQAVVSEGQSIILAGYTRNSDVKEVSKIPFLGDIPLLGWFFKSATTSSHKISTLYIVTPRVVWLDHSGGQITGVTIDNSKFDLKEKIKVESDVIESHE